jgi:DNA-binding SARP family transcriptional activator/WD40 repeat protein/energy-coupling factor transporter ATP-binding protein EcfA2
MARRHGTELHRTAPVPGREAPSSGVDGSDVHVPDVRVLGPLSVHIDGRQMEVGGPKPTLLLALLIARPGVVVSLDALIDGLWGDDPPPTARKAVQVHVSNLRRALGDEFPLCTAAGGYLVDADELHIDAVEFERTVAAAGAVLEDDPGTAAKSLREALTWWSGPAYAGLGDCEALAPTISRLTELRLHAQSILYDARLRLGQHVEVVGDLDALTTDHPYREDLRRLQMLALYRSGRQTEALRVYTRTRALLVDELGIEPSAELRELQGMILDQSPDLELVAPVVDDVSDDTGRANGYELRQRLGADEIGVVYSAYQTSTGREVAVKVIRPEFANQPDFVERFEAEAQHVAGLEHPHIVALYDYWRSPDGAYLVMPYVRGGNLRRSIEATRWDPAAAMRVLDQIGSALGHAHRHGIVHGDLDSTKVLLDDDLNAYLFDFGIARRRRADAGEPGAGVGGDIRAFGFLAHELFSGTRPTPGEPLGSVHWSRNDLPQGLDEVIARSLAADPAVRFQRIDDCLRALRQVFGADVTTGPSAPVVDVDIRNPYKGLRAFAEVDADDYFGRDRLVTQLSERVARHRLTVVVGPSGSGKSSLVKAGLLPLLRRDGLQPGRPTLITEMYPGSYPFEELEAALLRVAVDRPVDLLDELVADDRGLLRATKQILPDDDSDLVLVIDQFEELFSLTADASVRRSFLDNLVTIGRDQRSRVRVVVTMRADFFDHPLEHPAFGELMADSLVTVAMPDHDDLARAIGEPARAAGLALEAGLVPIITRDVAGEPGALPLMQYALTELVRARVGRELTIEAYERTGGVIGALSSRAEDIFVGLPSSAQRVAEEMFVHLVAVDEDTDDTRRRVRRSELDAMGFNAAALDAVIAAFGSFRLLSFDHDPVTRGQTIEVAHEALIREWPRYRTWIEQRREDLVLQRRLQVAAVDWESSSREPSYLLGGGRLEQYELWAASTQLRVGGLERTFLDRSRQRDLQVAESATRRRHRLVGSFAVLAAAAVGVAAVALVQRGRADDAAALAQQAASEADSQRSVAERATSEAEELSRSAERRALIDSGRAAGLTAVELADEDPEAAVLVGLEAASIADEAGVALPEVIRGLWEGASKQHVRARFDPGIQKWIQFGQGVSPSPDGRLGVATAADETSATEWGSVTTVTDLATGETLSSIAQSQGVPLFSTWDPTTGDVLTANGDGSVSWWDPLSGAPVRREQLASGPLWHITVTRDRLATSENVDRSSGRSIAVLRDRSTLAPLVEVPDSLWSTLSPNGRWWATYAVTREIVFHDARTGVETFRIPHGLAPPDAMPFTDWAGQDDAMWLVRSNGALARIELGADAVMNDVSFDAFVGVFPVSIRSSPDGALLAFGDVDSQVRVHDARTGERIVELAGHQNSPVDAVEWLPDASGLVTVDRLGTALTWDLVPQSASGLPAVRVAEHPETSAQFGESVILLTGRRGSGRLVDTATGSTIVEFGLTVQGQDLDTVANEQSGVFVAPSDDGLRVYDVDERRWTAEIVVDGIDQPLALSDDSTRLLAGTSPSSRSGASPAAAMFDTETGEELWRIDRFLVDAAVMVDDKVVVAGSQWGHIVRRILVLDVETGDQIAASTRGWTTSAMTVSPDGARLATVRRSGEIIVYDLDLLIDSPTGQAEVVSNTATVTELVAELAYSTDGSMLFSGSVDGVLRAWDSETLEQRWSIDNGFSMSGLRVRDDLVWFGQPVDIRSGRSDAGFRLAAIPFDQASIAEWAATTVTRTLTDAECQEYLQRACSIRVDLS